MQLYNSLSHSIQEFNPITDNIVKLYSCGPTVYSYYHVGNLRNAVFNDSLRRALEVNGYRVNQAMNITDVGHLTSDADEGEDKLEKGARDSGKTVWEVAQHYTEAFKQDMAALLVQPPNAYHGPIDSYARATDFIEQQIELVGLLLDRGFAYQTKQAIYFEVAKLDSYGELSGQKLADKEVAARPDVVTDDNKRSPHDFGLWFFCIGHFADHSMKWSSPWGEGFPGWHLECSAIIHATLGDPVDIHTGGVDHIGTHHPNEMAQSEAAFGHKLANYWLHNEFVLIEGQKMSKSLNNFYTLADVTNKGLSSLALKYLYLQSHYRTQVNFTWESLEAAHIGLINLWGWADLVHQQKTLASPNEDQLRDLKSRIKLLLAQDLGTPSALATLNEFSAKYLPTPELLAWLETAFGLGLADRPNITSEQKKVISDREEARKTGQWDKADSLRSQLEAYGVAVNDTDDGPIWSRLA